MTARKGTNVALKILHTADWHLGLRFPSVTPEQEVRLTRARLEVVERILDLAESRQVDAVLCAGDLFNEPRPEEEWWKGLLAGFQRRSWTRPVILLPGNHDPLTPNSVYTPGDPFRRGLPDYVHVVDLDEFELSLGPTAVVYARPCRSHAGQTGLASSLPTRDAGDERIRIGLVHGQTFDLEDHQTTFPIERNAAVNRGLDYLAIGDTHSFRDVEPDARVPTIYPGAPESTKFGEAEAGHVALVFFPRDRARRALVDKEAVAAWSWREATCRSIQELRQLREESLRKTVLRLTLDMRLPLHEYDEATRILTELEGSLASHPKVGVLIADRSRLRLDPADSSRFTENLPEVLQAVVQRLTERAADEPEKAERALHHLFLLVQENR